MKLQNLGWNFIKVKIDFKPARSQCLQFSFFSTPSYRGRSLLFLPVHRIFSTIILYTIGDPAVETVTEVVGKEPSSSDTYSDGASKKSLATFDRENYCDEMALKISLTALGRCAWKQKLNARSRSSPAERTFNSFQPSKSFKVFGSCCEARGTRNARETSGIF